MKSTAANDAAFPLAIPPGEGVSYADGLTAREYFAAQALVGLLASPGDGQYPPKHAARVAFEYADAMILESRKEVPHADR